MSDKVNSAILGAAGAHYVMCQLLRRNMIAALAPEGVPDADIIVSNRIGSALAAIQVKARSGIGRDGGWHMKAKHESMKRDLLFYCFVDFGGLVNGATRCWIIPSGVVAEALTKSHQAWLGAPGKNGRAHQDTDIRRLLPDYKRDSLPQYCQGWLDSYLEAWELISSPVPLNSK